MALFDNDFDQSIDPFGRYHSYDDHCDGHRWSVASSGDSVVYSPNAASVSPTTTAMTRFLHEQDGPFFTTTPSYLWERELTPNPFGNVLAGSVRLPSPAYTSNASSTWSDQMEAPPFVSPEVHALPYSPFHSHSDDAVPFAFGGSPSLDRRDSHSGGCCVSMHDVQKTADEQPDSYHFDDEPMSYISYGTYTQEGYQPISGDDSQSTASHSGHNSDYYPQPIPQRHELASPVIRRRRAQSSRRGHSPASTSRISKRPTGRRSSSHQSNVQCADDTTVPSGSSTGRAFPCPLTIYGCTSSFGSKNEWKRHVTTQHMRLGFWRCDLCANERKPNDFNRKDLFTQHVRRMHPADPTRPLSKKAIKDQADDQYLQEAATRCYRALRVPPAECRCLFCDKVFRGHGAWDERMEHVGRHMESAKKEGEEPVDPREWKVDEEAEQWMLNEQIVVVDDEQLVLGH